MRVYTCLPGKLLALQERFETATAASRDLHRTHPPGFDICRIWRLPPPSRHISL